MFVWHRMDWNLLRPIVNMEEDELLDLKDAGSYVAGFTDPAIKLNEQYYDLLVDGSCFLLVLAPRFFFGRYLQFV